MRGGIIKLNLKSYMLVDLLLLALIGCVLEALCTKMVSFVLNAVPTATISLLILFISVARWKLWGLLIAPLLALSTILGGKFNALDYMAAAYDWKAYVSILSGLMVVGLNVIFYNKLGTKKTIYSGWKMSLIIVMNFLLYNVVQVVVYRLLTSGNLLHQGLKEFTYLDKSTGEYTIKNLCYYMENGMIYNLFGLAIAFIGAFILRSQGVINNVVDKLIDDKKQAELNENVQLFELKEETKNLEFPQEESLEDKTEDSDNSIK